MTRATSATTPGVVLKVVVTSAAVVLAAYLVWALRSLIVPACVGGLLAYICRPLVTRRHSSFLSCLDSSWSAPTLAAGRDKTSGAVLA